MSIVIACLLTVFVMEASALPMPSLPNPPTIIYVEDQRMETASLDAIFMGGATILGFVVFESLLNLSNAHTKPIYGKRIAIPLLTGAALGAIGSFFLMLNACCTSNGGAILTIMYVLFAGVLFIVLGTPTIFDEHFKRQKRPSQIQGTKKGYPF